MQERILLIEDDEKVCSDMSKFLKENGYDIIIAKDGQDGIYKFLYNNVDLIILNLRLPKKTGIEVLTEVRRRSGIPIIMISDLNNGVVKNKCVELGVDDFIIKPCCDMIFIKSIKDKLRGKREVFDSKALWYYKDVKVDLSKKVVTKNGQYIDLGHRPMRIFEELIKSNGRILSRHQLKNSVYGESYSVGDGTINVHICTLRRKLGEDCIEAVTGLGYKIKI